MKIYHLTFEHAFENIKKYGLLRGYLPPVYPLELTEYNKIIDTVAEILDIHVSLRRYNTNYGFVFGKLPSPFLTVYEARNVCLEIEVDPNEVYISDMETITRGFSKYLRGDENYIFEIYDYWEKLVPLKKYIDDRLLYNTPEVLIPYDIPPEKIEIIDCEILIDADKKFLASLGK